MSHPIAIFVVLCMYIVYRVLLRWRIGSMYRAIKTDGYPVTLKELDDWYAKPPEGDNAADEILRAGKILREISEAESAPFEAIKREVAEEFMMDMPLPGRIPKTNEDWNRSFEAETRQVAELAAERGISAEDENVFLGRALPTNGTPIAAEVDPDCERYLAPRREALERVHRAVQKSGCRFPMDFTQWPEAPQEHLKPVRNLARCLRIDVALRSARGDADGAIRSLETAFRLADTLTEEPTIMSQLTRNACLSVALGALSDILTRLLVSEEQLSQLESAIKHIQAGAYDRAIAGERCLVRGGFKIEKLRPDIGKLFGVDTHRKQMFGWSLRAIRLRVNHWRMATPWFSWRLCYQIPYKLAGLEEMDELYFVSRLNRLVRALKEPIKDLRDAIRLADDPAQWIPPFFAHSATSMLWGASSIALVEVARKDLARMAIAVERFRLRTGALPANADDLVPTHIAQLPVDPFDERPIKYERLEPGYTLYSVGHQNRDTKNDIRDVNPHRRIALTVLR